MRSAFERTICHYDEAPDAFSGAPEAICVSPKDI